MPLHLSASRQVSDHTVRLPPKPAAVARKRCILREHRTELHRDSNRHCEWRRQPGHRRGNDAGIHRRCPCSAQAGVRRHPPPCLHHSVRVELQRAIFIFQPKRPQQRMSHRALRVGRARFRGRYRRADCSAAPACRRWGTRRCTDPFPGDRTDSRRSPRQDPRS